MALKSKRSLTKEDDETIRKLEPHVKVADLKVGGKTYTSKQFKALSPGEQQSAIELMVWEYEQKVYDKLGIK